MRKWILINLVLMLFLTNGVVAQVGKFCQDFSFTNTCYIFEEGNRFQYENSMCVALEEGKGRFEIEANTIRFLYEPIDFFVNQFIIKKVKNVKDSIKIKFSVRDYDTGKILNDYYVRLQKKGQLTKELSLHENQLSIKYLDQPIVFNVSSTEYSNYSFQVDANGKYEVDLFLKYGIEREIYEMKNGIEEFTIIESTKTKMTLKSKEFDYVMELILEE